MNKLLYITDQEEYSENGTISTLFDIYLKEYWDIDIVYITKYKNSFAQKNNHLIVPWDKQKHIIEYLERKGIKISMYDFIFVRNKRTVLQNVIYNQERFFYKIGFRASYPKKNHKLEFINTFFPYSLVKKLEYKLKIYNRDRLINKCDLFFPPSYEAKHKFYKNIDIETFPIFTGLDPDKLNKHIVSTSDITKFIYVGSIDPIRQFNIILDAFVQIKDLDWHLTISTTNKSYINSLLKEYPELQEKISLNSAMSLEELREQINENDIGIALLPRNSFYDTVIADKVIDYYSCSLPAILTSNPKNHSIFNSNEAFFCNFDVKYIHLKLEELINSPSERDAMVGNKGQEKLLSIKRNYKILAKELSKKMNSIIQYE